MNAKESYNGLFLALFLLCLLCLMMAATWFGKTLNVRDHLELHLRPQQFVYVGEHHAR